MVIMKPKCYLCGHPIADVDCVKCGKPICDAHARVPVFSSRKKIFCTNCTKRKNIVRLSLIGAIFVIIIAILLIISFK
jgi:uncharacterized membrane protein YvbJ